MIRLLSAFLSLVLLAAVGSARAAPVDTGHLSAELVAQTQGVQPGGEIWVALRQDIDKGWHTYWRNPGDSGEATQLVWRTPYGWRPGTLVWPTPHRQPTGPLMNYGYTGQVLLPVRLQASPEARVGDVARLTAAASFLVCEEICIPEDASLAIDIPIVAGPPPKDPRWGDRIAAALAAAPKPAGLSATFDARAQRLSLAIAGSRLAGADVTDAYFFPYDATVLDAAKPQAIERGPQGLTLALTPGYAFTSGKPPAAMAGVLALADRAYEVSATPGPPPAGAAGLGPPPAAAGKGGFNGGFGLPLEVGFAILGGLILNLMPCVFPVLAMKAAAFANHAHDPRGARRQGLAFLAGVMVTFLALAGALIAAKAAGSAVGWGFQLQSPPVVAALSLVMLLVALNLSGLFEIGLSMQGAGAGLASRDGLVGAFATGALAVIVAAPCTAPFMAGALGFALTQSAPAALLIFAGLALGFAAPFTLLAFMPRLLRAFPRPGPWMEGLKKLLAFPMYAAAAWLVWVFTLQAGANGLAGLLAAAVLIGFAAWLYGVSQRTRVAGGRYGVALGAATVALLGAGALVALTGLNPSVAATPGATESATLPSEPWTPARLAQARAEGKPVFVNFTAAWCVTCQVNDRVALSHKRVADAFARTGTVYMEADWTKKDAEIAAELARHGRAGVPLYIVYGAGGRDGVILPQILTEGAVVKAIVKAAKPA